MEKQYTLWQRIKADTPGFFKRAQVFGLGLVTLGGSLAQVQGITASVTTALISAGGAMAAISQFAVKQYGSCGNPQP